MTGCSKLVLLAALLSGCAGSRGALHFDGRPRPLLVRPAQITERRVLPTGYVKIGEVRAGCALVEGRHVLDGVLLADVDCSQARLEQALRVKASAVGGELLVGKRCRSHSRRSGSRGERTLDVSCSAAVARPAADTLSRRPLEPLVEPAEARPEPATEEAWHIRLDYTPAFAGLVDSGARRADAVNELAHLPPGHRRLGDVVARCERGCSERGAYSALFAAAGRMGASDLVAVRCVQRGEGWLCTGTAAAFELNPRLHAAAR